jgi:cytoskeleton protein RodZ
VSDDSASEEEFRFHTVGEQLRAEREKQGLSLSDLAAKTRVPMRHLDAIENSDFGALPGTTYTVGFVRSYTRAVGLDEGRVISELRSELAQSGHDGYQAPTPVYEPTDPARVPSRWLAWTAALIGVLLVGAYLFWRSTAVDSPMDSQTVSAVTENKTKAAQTAKQPAAAVPQGPVVLTATDNVWVKIYDADDKRLYEKEMAAGDSFTVPADANKPMIVTGRPQVLRVTVGGQAVPPLGAPDRTIADVEVSAAALLARDRDDAVRAAEKTESLQSVN